MEIITTVIFAASVAAFIAATVGGLRGLFVERRRRKEGK